MIQDQAVTAFIAVENVFKREGMWRKDSYKLVSRIASTFHAALEKLSTHVVDRSEKARLASTCAVLTKMHWALCTLANQASLDQREDVERLLHYIAEIEEKSGELSFSRSFSELTDQEQEVLDSLIPKLMENLPEQIRLVPFAPTIGSLGQEARHSGHFRRASTLGGATKLTETSKRDIMDRFLSAHRLLTKSA